MAKPSIKHKRQLTQEYVRSILDYNPETGIFTWKKRSLTFRCAKKWNERYANKIAGRTNRNGYREVAINKILYPESHIAWLYMKGKMPKNEIDHINLIRDDNRIINLREATRLQNARNVPLQKRNKSGFKGVKFRKDLVTTPYVARIKNNKKEIHLGYFSSPKEAADAYKKASQKHHGEFGRIK